MGRLEGPVPITITRSLTIQSFSSSTIWARVPVYGEPLQQKKGTRPKNDPQLNKLQIYSYIFCITYECICICT